LKGFPPMVESIKSWFSINTHSSESRDPCCKRLETEVEILLCGSLKDLQYYLQYNLALTILLSLILADPTIIVLSSTIISLAWT
jgi:hypothetical protein